MDLFDYIMELCDGVRGVDVEGVWEVEWMCEGCVGWSGCVRVCGGGGVKVCNRIVKNY